MVQLEAQGGSKGEPSVAHSNTPPNGTPPASTRSTRKGRAHISAWVLPSEKALLLEVGGGSISEGIRRLLQRRQYRAAARAPTPTTDAATHAARLRDDWHRFHRHAQPHRANLAWVMGRRKLNEHDANEVLRILKETTA